MKKVFLLMLMTLACVCTSAKSHKYRFVYLNCIYHGVFVDQDIELEWNDRTKQCLITSPHDSKIDTVWFSVRYSYSVNKVREKYAGFSDGLYYVVILPKKNYQYDVYDVVDISSRNANMQRIKGAKLWVAKNTCSMDVPEIKLTFNNFLNNERKTSDIEMAFTGKKKYNYNFQMLMREFMPEKDQIDSSKYRHEGVLCTNITDVNHLKMYPIMYPKLAEPPACYLYDNPEDFRKTYKKVEPGYDLKILRFLQGDTYRTIVSDSLPLVVSAPHNLSREFGYSDFNDAIFANAIVNVMGTDFVSEYLQDATKPMTIFEIEFDSMGYVIDVSLDVVSRPNRYFDDDDLARIKAFLESNHSRFLMYRNLFIALDYRELDYLCSASFKDTLRAPGFFHDSYYKDNKGFMKIWFSSYYRSTDDLLDNIQKYLSPDSLQKYKPCSCWMTNDYIFRLLVSDSYQDFIQQYLTLDESDKLKVIWELAHPLDRRINLNICHQHISECELLPDFEKERLLKAILTDEEYVIPPGAYWNSIR